jgi:MFS family permease
MALRIAFFYACGMFSGTISGLLAYAISFMNGVAGLAGWRWMFILYVAVNPSPGFILPITRPLTPQQRRHPRHLLRRLHLLLPAQLPRLVQVLLGRRETRHRRQPACYPTDFYCENVGLVAGQDSIQGPDVLYFHAAVDLPCDWWVGR